MSKALRTVAWLLALASPALAEGPDDAFNPNTRPLKIDQAPRPAVATPPRTVAHEAPPMAPQDKQDAQDQQDPQDQEDAQDAQGWPLAPPPDNLPDDEWPQPDMTEGPPGCAYAWRRVYGSLAEVRAMHRRCGD
jgi:hypothetical protein